MECYYNITKTNKLYFIDISQKQGYARGVDWIMFLQEIVPTLLIEMFAKQQHKEKKHRKNTKLVIKRAEALRSLSEACKIALKYTIQYTDLAIIEKKINVWHQFIKRYLPGFVFTINQHSLSHVKYIIEQQGPLRFISARPLERIIGYTKATIRSKSKIGQNAVNQAIYSSMLNQHTRHTADNDIPLLNTPNSKTFCTTICKLSNPLKIGGISLKDAIESKYQLPSLLSTYFRRTQQYTLLDQVIDFSILYPFRVLRLTNEKFKIIPGSLLAVQLETTNVNIRQQPLYKTYIVQCHYTFVYNNIPLCMIRLFKNIETSIPESPPASDKYVTRYPPFYFNNIPLENDEEDRYIVINVSQIKALVNTISATFDRHSYFIWNTSEASRQNLGNLDNLYLA